MTEIKKSNPDIQITAGGTTYTLRFSLRAMMALKDKWGIETNDELTERLSKVGPFDFTTIMWAALRTHHPELSEDQVLGIVDDLGVDGVEQAVGDVVSASTPEPSGDPKKG